MRKLLLVVLVLFCHFAKAQQYSFINYSVEDGLPHTQISTIFQDKEGYLWIGTTGGVARYNGKDFVSYSTDDGMLDNQVNCVYQTKDGTVWLGTLGGIMRWDAFGFKKFPLKTEMKNYNVLTIAETEDNTLWLGTDGAGVATFKESKYEYYNKDNGLVHNFIRDIVIKESGEVVFGSRGGVCKWNGREFGDYTMEGMPEINVSGLDLDDSGNLWVSTFGSGVLKVSPEGQLHSYGSEKGLINDWVRDVECENDSSFWVASKFGLSHIELERDTFFIQNFTEKNGMPYENAQVTLSDKEGNLWIGTDGGGVLKFAGESFVNFTTEEGLSSDIVMSIIEDRDHNLWFSTYGSGITKLTPNMEYSNYTSNQNLPNNTVWCSTIDTAGNVWFGTSEGVAMFNGNSLMDFSTKEGLLDHKSTSIYCGSDGTIYVGGKNGISVRKGFSFSSVRADKENMGKGIRSIFEDEEQTIWFGSSNGVYLLKNNQYNKLSTDSFLQEETVYSIVRDHKKGMWFGTKKGLIHYDKGKLKQIKIRQDYGSNFINFLLTDKSNHLWAGTNNGIYKADLNSYYKNNELIFRQFGIEDGLKSMECNLNACYEDSKGYLWFGTSKGLVRHQPEKLRKNVNQLGPQTHITNVRLFFEVPDWTKYATSYNQKGFPTDLKVPYNKNHFTFDYIGIYLTNPKSVQYQFKLEGFDEEWSPPTSATFATYSNLPFGEYTFKVRASVDGKLFNKKNSTFSFIIAPPFWRTWWFYSLSFCFLLLVALLVYLWRLNVRKSREEKQLLEYKSKMLMLEQQTLNASMNRHFVFNALNSIQYYINIKDQRSANKYLTDFAKLIRLNLDSTQADTIPLSDEIERLKIYLSLEHMRFPEKFDYQIDVDRSIPIDDILVPPMLLQPFVENSIIHGILPKQEKGNILVEVKNQNDGILLKVQDDGVGIDESIRTKHKNSEIGHASKGMSITKGRIDLIRKINSKYNISVQGPFEQKRGENGVSGTVVEIFVPMLSNK